MSQVVSLRCDCCGRTIPPGAIRAMVEVFGAHRPDDTGVRFERGDFCETCSKPVRALLPSVVDEEPPGEAT